MARKARGETNSERGGRFAEAVRELFPGLSRAEVGERLGGVSGKTVGNWERGGALSPEALDILEGMGVSSAYLLRGDGPMAEAGGDAPEPDEPSAYDPASGPEAYNTKRQAGILGANLRHLRKERFPDWGGQKKFADFLGLSANDLCVYEYGRAMPNEHRLQGIAKRLGLTVDELRRPLPGVAAPAWESMAPDRMDSGAWARIEDLKQQVARLEGRVEALREQNRMQMEMIRQLQEANYLLRDLAGLEDTPEAAERRKRLLSRLGPSIAEIAGNRDIF